jgi:folate-binding protein YgfZ
MAESPFFVLPRDTVIVRGPDRKTWLDGLVTCQVTAVVPGKAAYGLLLTKQGKIVSDVFLADDGTQLFIGLAPGHGTAVHELLDRYLVMEDAELSAPDGALSWALSADAQPGDAAPGDSALARGELELGTLRCAVAVARGAHDGSAPASELSALLAGHGLGSFGVDFDQHDNPHEASLDRIAVSWTKGCYLGQEVVCMQDMRGKVKRRLVALSGDAELLSRVRAAAGRTDVIAAGGDSVGHVTSAHAGSGGETRLLASLTSSALESQSALTVLGQAVRVVEAARPLLS